jgi:raffinose/stachyose/melibiose transport system permease protein
MSTAPLAAGARLAAARGVGAGRTQAPVQLRRAWRPALLFLAPFFLCNLVIIVIPSLATIGLSLTEWSGLGDPEWIGLDNYAEMLESREFWDAAAHNAVWTVIFVGGSVALGLWGAVLLAGLRRGQVATRLLFFLPYTIASVVGAAVWQNLYDPERGLGHALARIGLPWFDGIAFLGDTALALPAVALVNVWAYWGFLVVILLAAMHGVSPELYEAARLDGANRWQQFCHVTVPGIRPTLVFVLVISTMFSLLAFDYVWATTKGGPAGATELIGTLLYREAFQRFNVGYAAALGVSTAVICAAVGLVYVALRRRGWEV